MILFDFSGRLYASIHMNKETILENNNFIAHLMLNQIDIYAKKFGASKKNPFIICMDSSNTWRKDYYEDNKNKFDELKELSYKGNRKKDDSIPWDNIHKIINELCESLKNNSDYFVMKIDKTEADDIIAILSELSDEDTWIISSDKDFIQLQSDKVKIYDPMKSDFKPSQNVEVFKKIHVMIGDSSDNIPAIKKRLGEKTAIKILKDIDDMMKIDPYLKARYEFNENLILFNKIPDNIKNNIICEYEKQKFSYNATNLLKTFIKFNLSKFSENLQTFNLNANVVKTNLNTHFNSVNKNAEISKNNLEDFFS